MIENAKAAIYARVSTERQENENTVQAQIVHLKEYALKNGLDLIEEYIDEGWSGDTLIRPALDRLRAEAKDGRWTQVLIYDPDRLARRYSYQELVMDELKSAKINVHFMTVKAPENPEDKILYGVRGIFAEYERQRITERFRLGKLRRVKEGNMITRPPYGYVYFKRDESSKGHFKIDEEEAHVVRMIFDWAASGLSTRKIIKNLFDLNINPKRSERGAWATSTIYNIITNSTYIGQAVYGKHVNVEPLRPINKNVYKRNRKSSARITKKENWLFISVPAIITVQQFENVRQQLLLNKKWSNRNTKREYLLSGLFRCSCGKMRSGSTSRNLSYYRCNSLCFDYPVRTTCKSILIKCNIVDEAVWAKVSEYLISDNMLQKEAERHCTEGAEKVDLSAQTLKGFHKSLNSLAKQEERMHILYTEGILTLARLKHNLGPLQSRIKHIEDEINEIEKKKSDQNNIPTKEQIQLLVSETRQNIHRISFEEKRGILRKCITRMVGDINKVEVEGCFRINSDAQLCSNHRDNWSAKGNPVSSIPFKFNIYPQDYNASPKL